MKSVRFSPNERVRVKKEMKDSSNDMEICEDSTISNNNNNSNNDNSNNNNNETTIDDDNNNNGSNLSSSSNSSSSSSVDRAVNEITVDLAMTKLSHERRRKKSIPLIQISFADEYDRHIGPETLETIASMENPAIRAQIFQELDDYKSSVSI